MKIHFLKEIKKLSVCLLLLSLCSLTLNGQDDSEKRIVEIDSIVQDSIKKLILADETATSIPSEYADLTLKINQEYHPRLLNAQHTANHPRLERWRWIMRDLTYTTQFALDRNDFTMGIESLIDQWRSRIGDMTSYGDLLKATSSDLISFKEEIAQEQAKWKRYKEVTNIGSHPEEVGIYIDKAVDTFNYFIAGSDAAMDSIVLLYSRLVELRLTSQSYLEELNRIRRNSLDSLLFSQDAPLWKVGLSETRRALNTEVLYYKDHGIKDSRVFLKENKSALFQVAMFFIICLLLVLWTRSQVLKNPPDLDKVKMRVAYIVRTPVLTTILATFIFYTLEIKIEPPLLLNITRLIILACIIGILNVMFHRRIKWAVYWITSLFVVQSIAEILSTSADPARWLLFIVSVLLGLVLIRLRRDLKSQEAEEHQQIVWGQFVIVIFGLLIIALLAAIAMNLFGYGHVALVLNRGTISTLILGLLLLTLYHSVVAFVYYLLNTKLARTSIILDESRYKIHRFLTIAIRIALLGLFLYYTLDFFFLWEIVYERMLNIWNFGYTFGTIEITVGSIVNLFLTLFIFWAIGTLIKVILNREIFDRINLPRGVGNATSSMIQYIVVTIGFFLALAGAGFNIAHLGILAGALGVGIGFGLQTIVNNFLSGLILVFERPITVGDIIQIDDVLGVVTNIGIRASTIKKFNGDEAIIPNADLISKKVTNWTLSDTKRRYEMSFTTGRDVDPDQLITLITEAATNSPGVISDPPVKAYFEGMGDQSLRFYIHYWGIGNFLDLKSDVQKAVYLALKEAGVKMHIPVQIEMQKELRDDDV